MHELYLGLEKRMKLLEFIRVSIDEVHESLGSEMTFPAGLREGENIREEEQRKGEGESALEEENVSIGSIREGSNNTREEIRREGTSHVLLMGSTFEFCMTLLCEYVLLIQVDTC